MKIQPKSSTKTYKVWNNMKKRCNQKKNYPRHGGRGITYDPYWEKFDNFLEDMGERPDGYTLDRINNDGNYTKDNCRWATYEEQNINRTIRKDNTLGIIGVQPHLGGYVVLINRNKKRIYLGWTKDFFLACCLKKSWEETYG